MSGINPAIMKSRYGLKCHRWGSVSLLLIGSHQCGATCQGEEGPAEEGLAVAWTALPRGRRKWHSSRPWWHSMAGLEDGHQAEGCRWGAMQGTRSITHQEWECPFVGAQTEEASLPKASPTGMAGLETWPGPIRALAGFVTVCHRGGSEAPDLCAAHGFLREYRCRTPATVLGTLQHPRRSTQQGAGGWQPSCSACTGRARGWQEPGAGWSSRGPRDAAGSELGCS